MVVARTLTKKNAMMSVTTKVAMQLNCKLGGELWALEIPVSSMYNRKVVVEKDGYENDSNIVVHCMAGILPLMLACASADSHWPIATSAL